jgi:hypothetical protein
VSSQTAVGVGSIVKVTNLDPSRIFRGMWDLAEYVIPPLGTDFMPFEAMKLFFGDPRSTDRVRSQRDSKGIVAFLPDRAGEVRRLRLLYNHGFGDYTGKEGPDVVWEHDRIPHVKVTTLDDAPILTVLDDPAGHSILPAVTTQAEEADLRDTVIRQGRLLQSLMDRLGVQSLDDLDSRKNVYDPDTDEVVPERRETTEDPEMYDELPEDR